MPEVSADRDRGIGVARAPAAVAGPVRTARDRSAVAAKARVRGSERWYGGAQRRPAQVGDIFRAPSRTLTDAHATAFQAVSADNHPIHYNVEYARSHGHAAPVVHGLQVLAFTAPGATLFPQYIGDVFIAFTSVSCKFLAEIHAGDTLYPQLEIIDLAPPATPAR